MTARYPTTLASLPAALPSNAAQLAVCLADDLTLRIVRHEIEQGRPTRDIAAWCGISPKECVQLQLAAMNAYPNDPQA